MNPITVVVPVGPNPAYRAYLGECLDSIRAQTVPAGEILVIDDMANLTQEDVGPDVTLWKTPWLSGVAHVFNFGVGLAQHDLVFMLGSDDRLETWCLQDCTKAYQTHHDPLAYYYVDVQYSDGRQQSLACHAAMVTKALWRHNGGFPVESAVGAPDTVLISIMLAAKGAAGHLIHVGSQVPPYWYRLHDQTDTVARSRPFYGAIKAIRDHYTEEAVQWKGPRWITKR